MLRLNCIGIQFTTPESEYFVILSSLSPKEQAKAQETLAPFLDTLATTLDDSSESEDSDEEGSEDDSDSDSDEDGSDDESEEEEEEEDRYKSRRGGPTGSSSSSATQVDFHEISEKIGAFEGSGLFPTVARINHSCVPNAVVDYPDNNSRAVVRALVPIQPGEEVSISYLEEEDERDFEDRTDSLHDYQFECDCPRCQEENPANKKNNKKRKL